jgi:hypothetical protein
MFCFITAETTAASWISDFFRGFGMPLVAEKIGMVKGVKCIACEKSQGNNTKPKYRSAKIMVMDIGDIFDFSACFLEDRGCLILGPKTPGSAGRCEKRQVAKSV